MSDSGGHSIHFSRSHPVCLPVDAAGLARTADSGGGFRSRGALGAFGQVHAPARGCEGGVISDAGNPNGAGSSKSFAGVARLAP